MACTVRQCTQCRNILVGRLGTNCHQRFCLSFLQKKRAARKSKIVLLDECSRIECRHELGLFCLKGKNTKINRYQAT